MNLICDIEHCTGCGACAAVCAHEAISMKEDDMGCLHPYINQSKCVDCGLCIKTCPVNSEIYFNKPLNCYAAWSRDEVTVRTSASGGIATEFYKYVLFKGGKSVGVTIDFRNGCFFIPVTSLEDIVKVKNSKYVHPDTEGVFAYAKSQLRTGNIFLFIGLPCHIAALKSYLGKEYPNLITVDIICHGKVPYTYLDQHIRHIIKRTESISNITFRDPGKGTNKYFFSIYKNCKETPTYSKTPVSNDVYQIGYHKGLTYYKSCYSCRYAQAQRVGDITIGDFSGLARYASYDGPRNNVSCVLVNTEKGSDFINQIKDIEKVLRPVSEALNYEQQLKAPFVPHPKRPVFESVYLKTQDFEKSAYKALKGDIVRIYARKISVSVKKRIVKVAPIGLKVWVYKIITKIKR